MSEEISYKTLILIGVRSNSTEHVTARDVCAAHAGLGEMAGKPGAILGTDAGL